MFTKYVKPIESNSSALTEREFEYECKRIIKRILGFIPPNLWLDIGHGINEVEDFTMKINKETYIAYNAELWGEDYLEIQDCLGYKKGEIRFIPDHIEVSKEGNCIVFKQKGE